MKKMKVLFVDDDTNLLQGLKRSLRSEPFEILTAATGERALEMLQETDIHLLVTDQKMPGIKGLEFLDLVRTRHPSTVRIMLTGHPTIDTTMKAINRGEVFRFLAKPCDPQQLSRAIQDGLRTVPLSQTTTPIHEESGQKKAILLALEAQYPGITEVPFDENGAIKLEES